MSSSSVPFQEPGDTSVAEISDQTRALAKRLSAHMGLNAAIEISTANQWHGVVSALMEMKRKRPE